MGCFSNPVEAVAQTLGRFHQQDRAWIPVFQLEAQLMPLS